jgi:hypothetical protein
MRASARALRSVAKAAARSACSSPRIGLAASTWHLSLREGERQSPPRRRPDRWSSSAPAMRFRSRHASELAEVQMLTLPRGRPIRPTTLTARERGTFSVITDDFFHASPARGPNPGAVEETHHKSRLPRTKSSSKSVLTPQRTSPVAHPANPLGSDGGNLRLAASSDTRCGRATPSVLRPRHARFSLVTPSTDLQDEPLGDGESPPLACEQVRAFGLPRPCCWDERVLGPLCDISLSSQRGARRGRVGCAEADQMIS